VRSGAREWDLSLPSVYNCADANLIANNDVKLRILACYRAYARMWEPDKELALRVNYLMIIMIFNICLSLLHYFCASDCM